MDYKVKFDGGEVTVWDEAAGIGLRFYEGETMQRYTCAIVLAQWKELRPRDLERINSVSDKIIEYCTERWPHEFAPLKD